jgi:hypothetical protein
MNHHGYTFRAPMELLLGIIMTTSVHPEMVCQRKGSVMIQVTPK